MNSPAILQDMSQKLIVVPFDRKWNEKFEAEAPEVRKALRLSHVYHIGSTAIPGIFAKPIIDILGETADLETVEENTPQILELGYEAMGEFGIPGRRYFRKDVDGVRKFHLHVFVTGSDEALRHLRFRDFMRANPQWAQKYSELKQRLAAECEGDIDRYMDGKDPFIKEIDRLAESWSS